MGALIGIIRVIGIIIATIIILNIIIFYLALKYVGNQTKENTKKRRTETPPNADLIDTSFYTKIPAPEEVAFSKKIDDIRHYTKNTVMPFGKYKDKTIREIINKEFDEEYIYWLVSCYNHQFTFSKEVLKIAKNAHPDAIRKMMRFRRENEDEYKPATKALFVLF